MIVSPAPAGSTQGNRVTAERWARILEELGCDVRITGSYEGEDCDLLVALHARRSRSSVERFAREHPGRPVVLALTGTDLYDDIHEDAASRESLELARRLIVLQELGTREVPEKLRDRVRVIHQSVDDVPTDVAPRDEIFEVCVASHLRPVKDPLRAARAARLLPASSRVHVTHVGAVLHEDLRQAAEEEAAGNPRYTWVGPVSRDVALRTIARSRLLVVSSRLEGGANVVSEAIAASVPVLSSRISGSVGILGEDYPGYFPVGDTQALARLLERVETEPEFLADLGSRCASLRPLFEPARERQRWAELLAELTA
ncbi:MAG: selenoneine biosynthesis selenosugar synthase SenB [Planctomycetota bacterium]|nr:selenoneine biosynthesis selenosugar synthase SenB [Planctomycetota bacterium]